MDHSVELRTPRVDAHLLSQLQPLLRAFAEYPGKALLAGAPQRALPREVVGRRKTRFGIPVVKWLQAGRQSLSQAWAPDVVSRCYPGSE